MRKVTLREGQDDSDPRTGRHGYLRHRSRRTPGSHHHRGRGGKSGLQNVMVTQTGCIGICQFEPVVEVVEPGKDKVTYVKMTPEKAVRVVNDHLVNGNVVTEFTIGANSK